MRSREYEAAQLGDWEYDTGTGPSPQQDPIGIAGGANVYGFAGGDPVNYSDPFGLSCEPKPQCLQGGTLKISVTAIAGLFTAVGVEVGVAVDTEGRLALFGSLLQGVGMGAAAGVGVTAQTGSTHALAGGNRSGNFESDQPTTVTAAVGSVQGAITMPAVNGGNSGAGVTGTSRKLGVGAGLFVTQSTTAATAPTAPIRRISSEQLKQALGDAVRAMTCPNGCGR